MLDKLPRGSAPSPPRHATSQIMVGMLPMSIANPIFGAWLIASSLVCVSTGIAYAQFFGYFTSRIVDRPHLRYAMVVLVFITTVHAILSIHVAYYYLVAEYGDPQSASRVIWSYSVNSCLIELSNLIIRLLFTRRVWLLSQGNTWVTVVNSALSIGTFASATTIAILLQYVPIAASIIDKSAGGIYATTRRVIWSSFALNLAGELVLTGALCYYLYISKTSFKKTNSLIYTLIVYTIHTGLFILIGSTVATVGYLIGPVTNYTNIFYFLESSLYVNAYLVGLSARDKARSTGETVSVHLSQMNPTGIRSNTVTSHEKRMSSRRQGGIRVSVDQQIEVDDGHSF